MVAWQAMVCALAMSAGGETVLLDFSASWCGPCRQMEPVVQRLVAAGHPVKKIDIDQRLDLARQFKVDGVPCFVMLVDGREVGRQVGATTEASLQQLLRLASSAEQPSSGGLATHRGGAATTFAEPAENTAAAADSEKPRLIPKQITEPFNRMAQGIRNAVTGPQPPANIDPLVIERAMAASVRIRIHDGGGKSTGSGTIVDYRSGEALVATCGHIFRESKGQGSIEVDLFGPGGRRTVPGTVVSYDLKADIGLLRIKPGTAVTTAALASLGAAPRKGDAVFTVGCSHGDNPTSRVSHITSLEKFVGPSNIQVAGQPVQGRSGGGLFDAQGHLIGVCNAADPADDEGLYASLKVIHGELARVGLDQVLARPGELAAAPPAMPARMADSLSTDAPSRTRANAQSPDPQPMPGVVHVSLSSDEAAMLQQVRDHASAAEVICIVRPNPASGDKGKVVVIDRASPELLQEINRGHERHAAASPGVAEPRPSVIPQIRGISWLPKWGSGR